MSGVRTRGCRVVGVLGRRLGAAAGLVALLSASGCAASSVPAGKGLFWHYPRARLPVDGFPDNQPRNPFSPEWGTLYDERGVGYGPNSLYLGDQRLEHPELVVTDSTLANRWFRIHRNASATEPVFGHFVELLDLARYDLQPLIGCRLDHTVDVMCAENLDQYRERWGREYWLTHMVDARSSPAIVFEPMNVLAARGISAYTTRHAVAMLLLQQRTHQRLPPWLLQGLASYLAEEGNLLVSYVNEFRPRRPVVLSPEETARTIDPLTDRESGRIAQYNAFLMAWHLCERWGFDRMQACLAALDAGEDLDAACKQAWQRSYAQVMGMVDARRLGEPQGPTFGANKAVTDHPESFQEPPHDHDHAPRQP